MPCTASQILNHWATRKVPRLLQHFIMTIFKHAAKLKGLFGNIHGTPPTFSHLRCPASSVHFYPPALPTLFFFLRHFKTNCRDFPGSPMVRTPPFHCWGDEMGGTGSVPGQDTKILHAIRHSQKQTKDCRCRPLKASTMHRSLAKVFFF